MEAGRSPKQVTRRASLLFDEKSLNDLKKELSDIVDDENKLKPIDERNKNGRSESNATDEGYDNNNNNDIPMNGTKATHELTTSAALEMAINKNLTITAEVFDEEKP
eukprot:CAMPEP_0201595004 /NCGR_PEP_ID=MMETSP0190_2-20130828/192146_1 /ASSEMBLY_ACC=CAM_ASM_000263 /TAXON_ID=37353 /ORGANISM="Rosalina sp." /LENGTH=106 /DNA_ID=CAMNT_0048054833 /DNA_START=912 /DNA_END=1235 /DNA_ORIENTATION=-